MAKDELQYLNTIYYPQKYGKNKFDDKIIMVYRNITTGKKEIRVVDTPQITYYINKEEYFVQPGDKEYQRKKYVPKSTVDKILVPYRDLIKDIAARLGEESFLRECMREKNMYAANRLFLNPNIHQSDMDISDYYIKQFQIQNPIKGDYKITKGYSDIEVDNLNYQGFPDEFEAPCPIDMVTYYDDESSVCYCFVLLIESDTQTEFLENLETENPLIIQEVFEETKVEIKKLVVNIYDDEAELIKEYFNTVNECKPDFLGYWNMRFDINTFINRCNKLNMDPKKVISDKDFPFKVAEYYTDNRNQDPADSSDGFTVSSYTYYIDMMRGYASLRKTLGKKESYSLDYTTEQELGVSKIHFEGKESIQNLAYLNFRKFFKYNIRDVILLKLLEDKNADIATIYRLSAITNTRYGKTMKKTTCLKNYAAKNADSNGFIMSNNHNSTYGGEKNSAYYYHLLGINNECHTENDMINTKNAKVGDCCLRTDLNLVFILNNEDATNPKNWYKLIVPTKIRGAYVGDPKLNSYIGKSINNRPSKFIFENVIDFDFAALYPSIARILNADSSQEYGKIHIFKLNKDTDEMEDVAWTFIDHMISDDYIKFGSTWFNLPTAGDIIRQIERIE